MINVTFYLTGFKVPFSVFNNLGFDKDILAGRKGTVATSGN